MIIPILVSLIFFDRKNLISLLNAWCILIVLISIATFLNGFDPLGIALASFSIVFFHIGHLISKKNKKLKIISIFPNYFTTRFNFFIRFFFLFLITYYSYLNFARSLISFGSDEYNVYGHNSSIFMDIIPYLSIIFFTVLKSKSKIINISTWFLLFIIMTLTSRRTLVFATLIGVLVQNFEYFNQKAKKQLVFIGMLVCLLIITSRVIRLGIVNSAFQNNVNTTSLIQSSVKSNFSEFDEASRVTSKSDFFDYRDYAISSWIEWPIYFIPRSLWKNKPEFQALGKKYVKYEMNDLRGFGLPIYLVGAFLYSGGFSVLFFGSFVLGLISGLHSSIHSQSTIEKVIHFNIILFFVVFFFRIGDLTVSLTQILPSIIASLMILGLTLIMVKNNK